jgi:Zn-dependent M28 family amino/carboxypeptidase
LSNFLKIIFTSLIALSVNALFADKVVFTEEDSTNAYKMAVGFVKDCTPRNAGTLRGRLAANWIVDRVSRCGVDAILDSFEDQTPYGKKTFHNVEVRFKAKNPSAPWIVFMSHFDTAPTVKGKFDGANDSASTTGLLMSLTAALKRAGGSNENNILFVWTDGEECFKNYGPIDGFHGSRHLVRKFIDSKRTVRAAVCLDMLGDKNLNIMLPYNSTQNLIEIVLNAAKNVKLDKYVTLEKRFDIIDDHTAFLKAGFPAIDLIDFEFGSNPGWNDYWHTPNDSIDKISAESLFVSGRIASEILNIIDSR